MKATNTSRRGTMLCTLFALAAIGSGILAWSLHRQLSALRSGDSALVELEAQKKRAWDAEQRIRGLEAELAALRANPAPAAPAGRGGRGIAPADPAAAEARRAAAEAAEAAERAVRQSPEFRQAQLAEDRSEIEVEYSTLLRRLALPPAQQEAMVALLIDRERAEDDIEDAAEAQGVDDDNDALDELVAAAESEIDDRIRLLIGDQAYSEFQAYRGTEDQREEINQLQLAATHSGSPLTKAQIDQLMSVIAQTPAQPGGRGGNISGDIPGGEISISSRTMSAARSILAPEQLQVLLEIQRGQQAEDAMDGMIDRARGRN